MPSVRPYIPPDGVSVAGLAISWKEDGVPMRSPPSSSADAFSRSHIPYAACAAKKTLIFSAIAAVMSSFKPG
jgi:hypothetical protein